MLPLHEIDRLAVTVDEEWRSPAADAVAAAWGGEPGAARWWRSSASHVFVLPDPGGSGRSYLRFTPVAHASRQRVGAVADLVGRLHRDGVRVAAPVPSTTGTLVETVPTPLGRMHATCVRAAPGEQLDVGELTPAQARAWGASLASLHAAAAELDSTLAARLPTAGSVLEEARAALADDAPAAGAVRLVQEALERLPAGPAAVGIVHGDYELDNLCWEGCAATSYDFDEACVSWYAADLAHAASDLTSRGAPLPEHRERYDALLTGYLDVRPYAVEHLAHLPLHSRASAAVSLARLRGVLADDVPLQHEPLVRLRPELQRLADEHRAHLLDAPAAV
ncbi:phosphotransferase enzyme family protein [Kineococcus sp. SYSU DK018]|uniref:phosphotransferase enzyme family protein n=1 Tax=Kineococcus sp. SYSU DK018 TaxID=3383139 RepID=UPI003D7C4CE5